MDKDELLKMERALEAVAAAKAKSNLSDGALYLYTVAALITDEGGLVTDKTLADAVEDPDIACMADGIMKLVS